MTTSPPSPPKLTRRERMRRERRRRNLRTVAISLAATFALVLGGLVATDTLRLPKGPGPVLAGPVERSAADPAGSPADPTRPLTPDDPLRLWIAGDSLAGSLGPSLGEMTAQTGVVQPVFDSRISSSLENDGFFDWPEHAAGELARLDPEAITFIIGTNDATFFVDRVDWQDEYAEKVDEMMALLVGNGRDVYWVNVPTMGGSTTNELGREVSEIFEQVARDHPDVTIVDAYTLFADGDGDYASMLHDDDGDLVTMRTDDGVHLTAEGGDRIAAAVYEEIDGTWRITEQAVPDRPQQVVQTPGSSQLDGTYRPPTTPTTSAPNPVVAPTTVPPPTAPAPSAPPTTTPPTTTTPPATAPAGDGGGGGQEDDPGDDPEGADTS